MVWLISMRWVGRRQWPGCRCLLRRRLHRWSCQRAPSRSRLSASCRRCQAARGLRRAERRWTCSDVGPGPGAVVVWVMGWSVPPVICGERAGQWSRPRSCSSTTSSPSAIQAPLLYSQARRGSAGASSGEGTDECVADGLERAVPRRQDRPIPPPFLSSFPGRRTWRSVGQQRSSGQGPAAVDVQRLAGEERIGQGEQDAGGERRWGCRCGGPGCGCRCRRSSRPCLPRIAGVGGGQGFPATAGRRRPARPHPGGEGDRTGEPAAAPDDEHGLVLQ